MSFGIIIRKSKDTNWNRQKDALHKRRKEIAGQMQDGIMPRSQMMRGHDGDGNENKQTKKYMRWEEKNKSKMSEWGDINRKFKEHNEEGQVHTLDDIRPGGKFKCE